LLWLNILPMSKANCARALATIVSGCGVVLNTSIAVHLITLWRSLKWDTVESEWESTSTFGGIDSVKLAWSLLSLYFSLSAILSIIGFLGSVKRRPAYVRMYRDYWIGDLTFTSFATLLFALASFHPTVRNSICEEISRQPQLTSELGEAGLDLEDCEPWLQRTVVAGVGLMAIILIARVQFTAVLSSFHRKLEHSSKGYRSLEDGSGHKRSSSRRIFVLPQREDPTNADDIVVYAPVPLSSLSADETQELEATEAWFSREDYNSHRRAAHRRSNSTSHPMPQRTHRRRSSVPPKTNSKQVDDSLIQV